MGLSIHTGASYFRMTVPPNTLYGCHQFAEYTNNTSSPKVLKSVTLYLGSGKGTFTGGVTITSAGGPFGLTVYVGTSVGKTSTQATVTITNDVTNTSDPKPSAIAYTFNFSNPVTVNSGSSVQLWWWCEDTTGNKCLILDYNRGSATEASPNYTVTFNLAGGTRTGGGALVQSVAPGGNAIPPTCSRTGYTFDRWDGSYTNVTSDRTITAVWTVLTYTVTYSINGGSGTISSAQTKQYGVDLTLSDDKPYKFSDIRFLSDGHASLSYSTSRELLYSIKWNTKADGTGTSYSLGGTYTNNASVTLYAIYPENRPIREFPEIESTEDGYIFRRWVTDRTYTEEATTETLVGPGSTNIFAEYMYKITLNSGEGIYTDIASGESFNSYELIKYHGQPVTIPDIMISYLPTGEEGDESKQFSGWYNGYTPTGQGQSIKVGMNYTSNYPNDFTARFDLNTFTVTFTDGYSGSILKEVRNVSYGSSVYPPTDPNRAGHKFLGWLGDYSYVTSDRTIIALWGITPVWIMTTNGWKKYEPKED